MNNLVLHSYPKVNIFLKVSQIDSTNFHRIKSRFILDMNNFYDTLEFKVIEKSTLESSFTLDSKFGHKDIIYITYLKLKSIFPDIFSKNDIYIKVTKNIKEGGGLGGGSGNAALCIIALNLILGLNLNLQEMIDLSRNIGRDIAFFLTIYTQNGSINLKDDFTLIDPKKHFLSANVGGYGEIIEPFLESPLDIKIFTNDIHSHTQAVYECFDRLDFMRTKNMDFSMDSKSMLANYNIYELNDLYIPSCNTYELGLIKLELEKDYKKVFFSGSGSSFFSLREFKICKD